MTAIKSEYFVDEATGRRYVMSKLGGATNANGDDAANVIVSDIGSITQSRNRVRTALSETYARVTNAVSWPAANKIHEVNCLVIAVGDESISGYVDMAMNGANETVDKAILTEVDSADTDTQIERFLIGEVFTRRSKTIITDLGFLPVDLTGKLGERVLATGQATTNTVNTLTDSGATFIDAGIKAGDIAKNLTDGTEEVILTLTSDTVLTFTGDPFPDGNEAYEIVRRSALKLFVGAH